jgi:cell division protein FtsL
MIFTGPFNSVKMKKALMPLFLLLIAVIISSFAVIYCSHKVRYFHSSLERLHAKESALQVEYSMLLLERSTWTASVRVEQVAKDLGMIVPNKVIMIKP